jgi:hypothetical protein
MLDSLSRITPSASPTLSTPTPASSPTRGLVRSRSDPTNRIRKKRRAEGPYNTYVKSFDFEREAEMQEDSQEAAIKRCVDNMLANYHAGGLTSSVSSPEQAGGRFLDAADRTVSAFLVQPSYSLKRTADGMSKDDAPKQPIDVEMEMDRSRLESLSLREEVNLAGFA